jgi:antitoxin (DNA-binding transcriptional repressor) of toxin-antitoxin stability system
MYIYTSSLLRLIRLSRGEPVCAFVALRQPLLRLIAYTHTHTHKHTQTHTNTHTAPLLRLIRLSRGEPVCAFVALRQPRRTEAPH